MNTHAGAGRVTQVYDSLRRSRELAFFTEDQQERFSINKDGRSSDSGREMTGPFKLLRRVPAARRERRRAREGELRPAHDAPFHRQLVGAARAVRERYTSPAVELLGPVWKSTSENLPAIAQTQ